MVKEGVVIEVKDDYSLVMTKDMEVLRIKNKKAMALGQQIFLTSEDLYQPVSKRRKKASPWFKGLALAALVLLVIWATAYQRIQAIEGYVSLGTDQVIEVAVDDEGKILHEYDSEGQRVRDSDLVGLSLEEGLDRILDAINLESNENLVLATDIGDKAPQILDFVRDQAQAKGYRGDLIYFKASIDEFRKAHRDQQNYRTYLQEEKNIRVWPKNQNLSEKEKHNRLRDYGQNYWLEDMRKREVDQPEEYRGLPDSRKKGSEEPSHHQHSEYQKQNHQEWKQRQAEYRQNIQEEGEKTGNKEPWQSEPPSREEWKNNLETQKNDQQNIQKEQEKNWQNNQENQKQYHQNIQEEHERNWENKRDSTQDANQENWQEYHESKWQDHNESRARDR